MPVDASYQPAPTLPRLGPEFADPVAPARFPTLTERYRNDRWAARVGLAGLDVAEQTRAFGRFEPLPDNLGAPLAMRYHGHQFRTYNPELGDGRGFLYAQLRDDSGRLLDLGTKGSGQTPYSRSGDGRLTLKGGVREVLATAMLEALGVPTSKSFSLFETGEALERSDEPSPTRGAVLTRLSWSHIRFGTFQRHAFHDRPDLIAALVDYVLANYYPELAGGEEAPAVVMLRAVTARAARVAARWMAAGFVHGVLNTDNMNVTGESFDYGPYRFLPHNDPNFTAAYFDHAGLYAFGRQPQAVFWNLQQLAGCLTLVAESEPLVEALNGYAWGYRRALCAAFLERLGLASAGEEADLALVNACFAAFGATDHALRWEPFFFDWFGGLASERRALNGPRAGLYDSDTFTALRSMFQAHRPVRPERLDGPYFARSEPEELLYDEIEALWAPIAADDDWSQFEAKLAAIETARLGWGYVEPFA